MRTYVIYTQSVQLTTFLNLIQTVAFQSVLGTVNVEEVKEVLLNRRFVLKNQQENTMIFVHEKHFGDLDKIKREGL